MIMESCRDLLTSQELVPWIHFAVIGTLEDHPDQPTWCPTNKKALGYDLRNMDIWSVDDVVINLDVIEVRVVNMLDRISPLP